MPRLQDAVPGNPQKTWQRHANSVLIDPLHLAPESTGGYIKADVKGDNAFALACNVALPFLVNHTNHYGYTGQWTEQGR